MKHAITISLVMALSACATDGRSGESESGDHGGGGDDVLPKRGEMPGDPTIVSAVAKCLPDGNGADPFWWVKITASDPKGTQNLGTCVITVGDRSEQQIFSEDAGCTTGFQQTCAVAQMKTVKIVVSNETGGVTTATVVLELGGPTTPDDGGN